MTVIGVMHNCLQKIVTTIIDNFLPALRLETKMKPRERDRTSKMMLRQPKSDEERTARSKKF